MMFCRIPQYNASTLAEWYKSDVPTHTARFLRYMSDRTLVVLEVLDEAEIVTKTAWVYMFHVYISNQI